MSEPESLHPEAGDLGALLGARAAARLSAAPGGWRDLSEEELMALRLGTRQRRAVLALQRLVRLGFEVPVHRFDGPSEVGRVYGGRLGALSHEVMIALALDGRQRLLGEITVAVGGRHAMVLTAADVLRPVIRAGASGFVLVHNHPSGSPEPSTEDVAMTQALAAAADIVGIALVDHVVVAGRGGGYCSMAELGLIDSEKEHPHEQEAADPALRARSDQAPQGPAR